VNHLGFQPENRSASLVTTTSRSTTYLGILTRARVAYQMASLLKSLAVKVSLQKTPANAQLYQHEALSSPYIMRLLKLDQDLADGELVCSISHFNRAHRKVPKFYAISYCWGDPSPTRKIRINNLYCHIHENLWTCLHWLWEHGMFEYFWTDCLSLDQKNGYELGQQIPLMRHFYSRADSVFMFLGHGAEEQAWLDCLLEWDDAETTSIETIEAANSLVSLPFWQRVWIIQEVVLAAKGTLLAGTSRIDLDDFLLKVKHILTGSASLASFMVMWQIEELRRKRRQPTPLWRLLQDFQHSKSTNPIDKVYRLISLVDEPYQLAMKLDLRNDKTAQQVFWDVILQSIVLECSLADFDFVEISSVLATMYSEHSPSSYLRSLAYYSQDPKNPERLRSDATTVLSSVRAVHGLMRSYVPLNTSEQCVQWQDVLRNLLPLQREPGIPNLSSYGSFERLFQLALDIAIFAIDETTPKSASFSDPRDTYGWKIYQDFKALGWPKAMDTLLAEIPGPLSSSLNPSSGFVYNYKGGRLGLQLSTSSGYGKLYFRSFIPPDN